MMLEPLLDVRNIQGNILAGFNKDHWVLVFVRIREVVAFKRWLAAVCPRLASTADVLQFNAMYKTLRGRLGGVEPVGLAATWFNIAFTQGGISKLTTKQQADALPDEAFRIGMLERATALLGDSDVAGAASNPAQWKIGGPGRVPDAVFIVASDRAEFANDFVASLLAASGAEGFEEMARDVGKARSDLKGHEHFGFKDGISQPGVRGRIGRGANQFLTPRLLDASDPLAAAFAKPGQPLIMPGHFVLGYATQNPHDGKTLPAARLPLAWFKGGSFLVYRRLRQDVAALRRFLARTATQLGIPNLGADRLAALFVGRWPDGTPLVRAPRAADTKMARDVAANAFGFDQASPVFRMRPGLPADAVPAAPADPLGQICPHWAHIRKVNPRDEQTDLGDAFDTLVRRMLRRGVPYGEPMPEPGLHDDGVDRGLLFLAYQASIEQSFEKVSEDWVNSIDRPSPKGHDPLIGQNASGPTRQRQVSIPMDSGADRALLIDQEWVTATGGGYFFSPSIRAVATHLALR